MIRAETRAIAPAGTFNHDAPLQRTVIVFFENATLEITVDMLRLLNDPDGYHWVQVKRKIGL